MENEDDSPFLICGKSIWRFRDLEKSHRFWHDRISEVAASREAGDALPVWWTTGEYSLSLAGLLCCLAERGGLVLVIAEPGSRPELASPVAGRPGAWSTLGGGDETGGDLPLFALEAGQKVSPVLKGLGADESGLVLATTGTSGQPKWVVHRMGVLAERYASKPHRQSRVLPLMNLAHIGGQDIFWRAVASRSTLVVPEEWSPEGVGCAVHENRVTHLAATPTFLRGLLWREVFAGYDWGSVERITYGGEVMPEALLSQLQRALPGVHLEQRYGLSETSAWSVRDVGDGFLAISGKDWKVDGGRLWCRTPESWRGYWDDSKVREPGSWYDTGDRVEQRVDGAIRILGREGLMINVGGHKVSPESVEEAVLGLPGVQGCRAYARPDPILGQAVAVDLVVDPAQEGESWRKLVRVRVRERVGREAVPVLVRVVKDRVEWRLKQLRGNHASPAATQVKGGEFTTKNTKGTKGGEGSL